jgi:N-acetylglucosamine-6-sulfatase
VAFLVALVAASSVLFAPSDDPAGAQTVQHPNIVLIVTDDQRFDTLQVMPEVQRLANEGMTLRRAIVTNPLCCPSRATILTGRYSHGTGVYKNAPPDGGWPTFLPSEGSTIATALDQIGYRTALIGKYLNEYLPPEPVPPDGWDRWFAFTGNGAYYDYEVLDDLAGFRSFKSSPKDYSTDVLRSQAESFIRNAPVQDPLFLMVTPFGPHRPYLPAERHRLAFADAPVKLRRSVNEADVSDKPAFIRRLGAVRPEALRDRTRRQWATLLSVDQLVGRIMKALVETGRADDTIVIFVSDNGILNGEHRWNFKSLPYEESIRVPFVIWYPGDIPAGNVSNALVSNVDIAPTIADFAGAALSADGVSLRPLVTDQASSVRHEVLLEHLSDSPIRGPGYCGVRTGSFLFARYESGEEELYDLAADPYQMENAVETRPNKAAELRSLTQTLCDPIPPGFSWEPDAVVSG